MFHTELENERLRNSIKSLADTDMVQRFVGITVSIILEGTLCTYLGLYILNCLEIGIITYKDD